MFWFCPFAEQCRISRKHWESQNWRNVGKSQVGFSQTLHQEQVTSFSQACLGRLKWGTSFSLSFQHFLPKTKFFWQWKTEGGHPQGICHDSPKSSKEWGKYEGKCQLQKPTPSSPGTGHRGTRAAPRGESTPGSQQHAKRERVNHTNCIWRGERAFCDQVLESSYKNKDGRQFIDYLRVSPLESSPMIWSRALIRKQLQRQAFGSAVRTQLVLPNRGSAFKSQHNW